jgi:undecaprenyl phosphate-alpha-L-ara4N flippase subunit ArnE
MSPGGLVLVATVAATTVAANLLLRAGIARAGGFAAGLGDLPAALARLAAQPAFDAGFLFYGLASLLWFKVVASEPLSTAYPLLVSLTFVCVTLGAAVLFDEAVTARQVVGLAVILVGITIASGR